MSAPTTPRAGRQDRFMDPFTAGLLCAGLLAGAPVAVAIDVAAGRTWRGVLVPAAALAVTVWLWRRTQARDVTRRTLLAPLVARRDLPQFLAGAVFAVLAIAGTVAGVAR